ncbi:uroporphyrinogen-III C-methyltransferase [Inhella sp.]|uniref:uroporphyrinogen-III C-methyltransferase n=1 Tax=Inhella sp. TaxID=1921806 RepID=UPI0035B4D696
MNTHPVCLVGAGPGDPELLTVRALKRLEAADVVLADDLIDPRVLALVKGRLLRVGKRGGCISTDQAFIHALMVREALVGRRVVRLKGGDPFVFGRGGEEVDALRDAGLEVEVVSGLTSGIAGVAAAGIPVTDRRASPGVILVTGHPGPGCAEPDWAALARSGLTLVVYMGVARCAGIVQQLLEAGMAPSTPAALVHAAHTPAQAERFGCLHELPALAAALGSPSLLVIGTVCAQGVRAALARTAEDPARCGAAVALVGRG